MAVAAIAMERGSQVAIPKESWNRCEAIIDKLGRQGNRENNTLTSKEQTGILRFLRKIGLCDNKSLTKIGYDYYIQRFVYKNDMASKQILRKVLENYVPVVAICEILWGRSGLTRESVYRVLLLKGFISERNFGEQDVGSFLMLLSRVGIVKYDRKKRVVTILHNPQTSENQLISRSQFLSPDRNYSNVLALRRALRRCKGYIYWIDKHFSKKGFEPISEEADATKIKEVRILTGTYNVTGEFKNDYQRLKKEFEARGIKLDVRIVASKDILGQIHDRWIVSQKACFNLPPVNSIYQGQYAEIKPTENRPPFEQWWNNSSPL